ncbi:MAG: DUF2513 domain-containing protein [Succinivibrio sp.]|nr:DUF2513 domain-containing protein [Succinivibrio sp.]
MKRDWNLIRELLINIRDGDEVQFNPDRRQDAFTDWSYFDTRIPTLHGHDWLEATVRARTEHQSEVETHLELMLEAGLISGPAADGPEILAHRDRYRLTLHGYDLLDVMEQEDLWRDIKTELKDKSLPLSDLTITELGKRIVLKRLALK